MRIVNLVEDTEGQKGCLFEHGLSFYIETEKHKLLMDTGATDVFLHNAEVLGINLAEVDTVIVSHGHYDHAGGVMAFSEMNSHAKIYMRSTAGLDYVHLKLGGEKYIGIDKDILELPQMVPVKGDMVIDEELALFTNIKGRRLWPQRNLELKRKVEVRIQTDERTEKKQMTEKIRFEFVQDSFEHEQCLVVTQNGKYILLSGCAHNGILNILDKYQNIYHGYPDVVISGFHMVKKTEYTEEELRMIQETARELKKTGAIFYSGHCTGKKAFDLMKEIMGEQLVELHSGNTVI